MLEENSESEKDVASLLLLILNFIKSTASWISEVLVQADNAPAYAGQNLALAISILGRLFPDELRPGIRIISLSHNEAGTGKSRLDGHFGVLARHLRDYVCNGYDVSTPVEAFKALCYKTIASSVPTFMTAAPKLPFKSSSFPDISRVFKIAYQENGDIICFEASGIGIGRRIFKKSIEKWTSCSSFEALKSPDVFYVNDSASIDHHKSEQFVPMAGVKLTALQKDIEREQKKLVRLSEDASEEKLLSHRNSLRPDVGRIPSALVNRVFRCPTPHCTSFFRTERYLLEHIDQNKHDIRPKDEWKTSHDIFLDMTLEFTSGAFDRTNEGIHILRTNRTAEVSTLSSSTSVISSSSSSSVSSFTPISFSSNSSSISSLARLLPLNEIPEDTFPSFYQGWALFQQNAPRRLTEQEDTFLRQLYQRGVSVKSGKVSPLQAAKIMRNQRDVDGSPTFQEYLSPQRISSFDQTLSKQGKKSHIESSSSGACLMLFPIIIR